MSIDYEKVNRYKEYYDGMKRDHEDGFSHEEGEDYKYLVKLLKEHGKTPVYGITTGVWTRGSASSNGTINNDLMRFSVNDVVPLDEVFSFEELMYLFSDAVHFSFDTLNNAKNEILAKAIELWTEKFEACKKLRDYVLEQGYSYSKKDRILERTIATLQTNQLLILSGPSGTGKTSLARLVAEALEGEFVRISVQPNWTDNQDLLGYYNVIQPKLGFVPTAFTEALIKANNNPDKQFIICLDEMNLAHVEYYFSEILSAMEDDKLVRLYSDKYNVLNNANAGTNDAGEEDAATETQVVNCDSIIRIPNNVHFIGTVNMDSTTKSISPKVLDRSYVIEIKNCSDADAYSAADEIEFDFGDAAAENEEVEAENTETEVIEVENAETENAGAEVENAAADGTANNTAVMDDLEALWKEILPLMSHRARNHAKIMMNTKLCSIDDIIVGKVLPLLSGKDERYDLNLTEKTPISKAKFDDMQIGFDRRHVYDYWN